MYFYQNIYDFPNAKYLHCSFGIFTVFRRKKRYSFSAYHHITSQSIQKTFLFGSPVAKPHNNNCSCEQTLHMKAERLSLNSARSQPWATEESSQNKTHLCDLCLYHMYIYCYFWKDFCLFICFSLCCLLLTSLLRKSYFDSRLRFISIYSTWTFFFKIYKDHFIQIRNVAMTGVNSLTVSTSSTMRKLEDDAISLWNQGDFKSEYKVRGQYLTYVPHLQTHAWREGPLQEVLCPWLEGAQPWQDWARSLHQETFPVQHNSFLRSLLNFFLIFFFLI